MSRRNILHTRRRAENEAREQAEREQQEPTREENPDHHAENVAAAAAGLVVDLNRPEHKPL